MPDITNIASPSTVTCGDIGGKRGVNDAKAAETDDDEQKSQTEEVSFLASFQQSLATLSEQSEKAETPTDGNVLPAGDEAAALFRLISEQPASADNEITAALTVTDPLQRLRRPATGTAVMQQTGDTGSRPLVGESTGVPRTDSVAVENVSLLASHTLEQNADKLGEIASTDRRAFEMLMSGDRTPAAESSNVLRAPAQMSTATSNTATVESTASITGQTTLAETFGQPKWGQGLGQQMLWMVNQNMHSAEMRLNPAHLGPIEVRIEMADDQVSVAFNSQHAVVREALEMAMPRLREMFESNGMNLSNADISHQSFAEQHNNAFGDNDQQHGFSSNLPMADETLAAQQQSSSHVVNNGMIDCYI